ncbi:DsbA family protein [Pseudarthrobacter sp. J1738]|uniref:DsbA family protein n=1 Tax=Pseudarthrobacter sp. J1738 TaxID=3420446 RepID=UPI003D2979F7
MSSANEPRLSKAERTALAREKAREIREQQLKKDKRTKQLTIWGVVVAVVAIIAVVAVIVSTNIRNNAPIADQGPTPANGNVYGGVTLAAKTDVVKSAPATVNIADIAAPTAAPTQGVAAKAPGVEAVAGKPVKVVAYIDFICPICNNFEKTYGAKLTELRNAGKITVEYRALGFLDQSSTTNYSSRAANAAACVANSSPEKYSDFFTALFEQQPAEGSAGLPDSKLKSIATDVGAADISKCVDEKTYRPYVKYTTQLASAVGVTGTPTVFVDGQQWGIGDSAKVDFAEFLQKIVDAKK